MASSLEDFTIEKEHATPGGESSSPMAHDDRRRESQPAKKSGQNGVEENISAASIPPKLTLENHGKIPGSSRLIPNSALKPPLPNTPSSAKDGEFPAFIQSQKGGILLKEFSLQEFSKLGRHMIAFDETEEGVPGNASVLWVDIKMLDGTIESTKISSGVKGNRDYLQRVKKYLRQPGHQFRVRPPSVESWIPFEQHDAGDLKIVLPDTGHYYISTGWNGTESADMQDNTKSFKSALNYLFSNELPR